MRKLITLTLAASVVLSGTALVSHAEDDTGGMSSSTFKSMKMRNIGPAYMSGRIADIAVDQQNPSTWYVGVGSGGGWKTVNNGTTWKPIFDNESVYSVGDVTIAPSNSSIV